MYADDNQQYFADADKAVVEHVLTTRKLWWCVSGLVMTR